MEKESLIFLVSAIVSAVTFAIIIGTEQVYGGYTDAMWQETLTFIPFLQKEASKDAITFWEIYSDAGLALI